MTERKTINLHEIKCDEANVSPEMPANGQLNVTMKGVDVKDLLEAVHMEVSPAELMECFGLDYFLDHVNADEVESWLNENSHKLNN